MVIVTLEENMDSVQGNNADPSYLMQLHEISEEDLTLIRKVGRSIVPRLDEYVKHFTPG